MVHSRITFLLLFFFSVSGVASSGQVQTAHEKALFHKRFADRLLLQGNYSQAIKEYERSTTLDPFFVPSFFNLAIAQFRPGHLREAATALETVVAIDPRDAESFYNLACLKLYHNEPKDCSTYLDKAGSCCAVGSKWDTLTSQAKYFLGQFQKADPLTQKAYLLFLQKNLFPQTA